MWEPGRLVSMLLSVEGMRTSRPFRTRRGLLVAAAAAALASATVSAGCAESTESTPSAKSESAATSVQDVAVSQIRRAFRDASPITVGTLGSSSATGMTTTWDRCVERSAKRDDATTRSVSYVFAGDGENVVNIGSGFGKTFVVDATPGSDPRNPDVVGYPASSAPGGYAMLDVARIASNGDLVVERVLTPASADGPFDASPGTEYERAIYPDPRAFATAYVRCPRAERTRDGGGKANVVVFDDCRDSEFSLARWRARSGPYSANPCQGTGYVDLEGRGRPIRMEVTRDAGGSVFLYVADLQVGMTGNAVSISSWDRTAGAAVSLGRVDVAPGTSSLRIEITDSATQVFAGDAWVATLDETLVPSPIGAGGTGVTSVAIW